MNVEFYASNLLDRIDWNHEDFPAFARLLKSISHPVTMHSGSESFNVNVITVSGKELFTE